MNCSPLVSVRIPSYNHEKYIFECISSVLNQTYTNYEIVIVDDCSTDRTLEIIREFKDSRIKVNSLSINSGMNVAVEKCMSSCNGEYIANMCSDDVWAPTKLEKQVLFLEQNKSYDAVFTKVEFIDEKGYTIKDSLNKYSRIFDCENKSSTEWLRHFFYYGNCLCNPSVLIRKNVYKSFNYQDKRLLSLSDFDLWVKLSFEHQFWILDEKLTKFRIRDMDMNVSAETPGSINRSAFEYKQILDHYLKIKDPDLLIEIFPECIKYGEPEKNTIPYFLGRLAIDSKGAYSKLWGCEKIFNLMKNDRIAAVLEKSFNFRYKDLISLTAETNIFFNDNHNNRVFFEKIKRTLRGFSPRLYTQFKKAFNKDNPKG